MIESILDFFVAIADLFYELKFWKKKKARRKFEKENNLPKKVMIHPYLKFFGIFIIIIFGITLHYLKDPLIMENQEQRRKLLKLNRFLKMKKTL